MYEVNGLKTGDIVEHSGGYNCTQTQFYIICGFNKTGKKATLQSVAKKQVSGDWMNGAVAPEMSKIGAQMHEVMVKVSGYNGETYLRGRINHDVRDEVTGEIKWTNRGSLQNFYKWDGKDKWNNCD